MGTAAENLNASVVKQLHISKTYEHTSTLPVDALATVGSMRVLEVVGFNRGRVKLADTGSASCCLGILTVEVTCANINMFQ